MRPGKTVLLVVLLFACVLQACAAPAENENKGGFWSSVWEKVTSHRLRTKDSEAIEKPPIPLSKEEMLEIIGIRLETYPYLVQVIPAISSEETADGVKKYFFETPAYGKTEMSELDLETLYHGVFLRISNEVTRRNTEKLMKDLRRGDRLEKQMRRLRKD